MWTFQLSRARAGFERWVDEPRPSWAASFVRQALEASDVFEPSSARPDVARDITTHTARMDGLAAFRHETLEGHLLLVGVEGLTPADEAQLQAS